LPFAAPKVRGCFFLLFDLVFIDLYGKWSRELFDIKLDKMRRIIYSQTEIQAFLMKVQQ
jgi:hypothetical protein